jgi:hypothetical protein
VLIRDFRYPTLMYGVSSLERSKESLCLCTLASTTSILFYGCTKVRHSHSDFTKNTAKYIRWDKNQLDAVISRFFEGGTSARSQI